MQGPLTWADVSKSLRIGLILTTLALLLLGIAIAGVTPYNVGVDCSDQAPNPAIFVAWVASGLLGIMGAISLSTRPGEPKGLLLRRVAFWLAVLVPVGAVALYIWTVLDGVRDCGF
jgi:hypothetical protein